MCMLDDGSGDYYKKHVLQVRSTVFRDAYYASKFWGLLAENIRKTHNSLAYILRVQYRNADAVFMELSGVARGLGKPSLCGVLALSRAILCPSVSVVDCMSSYKADVFGYLIVPVLRRHGMYSPLMAHSIFVNLVCSMMDTYVEKGWALEGGRYIENILNCLDGVPCDVKTIDVALLDEVAEVRQLLCGVAAPRDAKRRIR